MEIASQYIDPDGQREGSTIFAHLTDSHCRYLGGMRAENERTVLRRRFNWDNRAFGRYGKTWTEMLPGNERLSVNGQTYVHRYDCITDYIL